MITNVSLVTVYCLDQGAAPESARVAPPAAVGPCTLPFIPYLVCLQDVFCP